MMAGRCLSPLSLRAEGVAIRFPYRSVSKGKRVLTPSTPRMTYLSLHYRSFSGWKVSIKNILYLISNI